MRENLGAGFVQLGGKKGRFGKWLQWWYDAREYLCAVKKYIYRTMQRNRNNCPPFRFKARHFLAAIAVFCAVTGIVAGWQLKDVRPPDAANSIMTELLADEPEWDEGVTMLFFYHRDSDVCRMMRCNVERLSRHNVRLYAVDVVENSECFYKYNVSGVPCLLIFDGFIETGRVMGVVSTANLERITDRVRPPLIKMM